MKQPHKLKWAAGVVLSLVFLAMPVYGLSDDNEEEGCCNCLTRHVPNISIPHAPWLQEFFTPKFWLEAFKDVLAGKTNKND